MVEVQHETLSIASGIRYIRFDEWVSGITAVVWCTRLDTSSLCQLYTVDTVYYALVGTNILPVSTNYPEWCRVIILAGSYIVIFNCGVHLKLTYRVKYTIIYIDLWVKVQHDSVMLSGNNYNPTFTQHGKELAYTLTRGAIKMQGDITTFSAGPKINYKASNYTVKSFRVLSELQFICAPMQCSCAQQFMWKLVWIMSI